MFERYTEAARRLLFFARYEATQSGSISIETEHLLLGLLREGARRLLPQAPLDEIRRDLERRVEVREKTPTSVEMPFSAEVKRVLQYAMEESDRLQHRHIGPEHLVLGLLREETSTAATILAAHGVTLAAMRDQAVRVAAEERPQSYQSPVAAGIGTHVILPMSRASFEHRIGHIIDLVGQLARAQRESGEANGIHQAILTELAALNPYRQ